MKSILNIYFKKFDLQNKIIIKFSLLTPEHAFFYNHEIQSERCLNKKYFELILYEILQCGLSSSGDNTVCIALSKTFLTPVLVIDEHSSIEK
jgi:hypothetical protein